MAVLIAWTVLLGNYGGHGKVPAAAREAMLAKYHVKKATLYRWIKEYKERGHVRRQPGSGRQTIYTEDLVAVLEEIAARDNWQGTDEQYADLLRKETGQGSTSSIRLYIKRTWDILTQDIKPLLRKKLMKERVAFAKARLAEKQRYNDSEFVCVIEWCALSLFVQRSKSTKSGFARFVRRSGTVRPPAPRSLSVAETSSIPRS